MADAVDYTVTTTPVDVVTALNLESGKAYYGQNLSTTATLFGRSQGPQPSLPVRAFRYEAAGDFEFTVGAGEKTWFWTDDPGGCPIILNELS